MYAAEPRESSIARVAMVMAGAALLLSCSPSSPTDPGQTVGQIQIVVSTTGTGIPASFSVSLNGGPARSVSPSGSETFGSLNAGNYQVELVVAANCAISGAATRTVGVQEGSTATVSYSVSCSAVPTGAIGVTTTTTGAPADPDGYTVSVDGGAAVPIGVNDNLLLADLGLGDHEVELGGVAVNCAVAGENPRTVDVIAGETVSTTFDVSCSATVGSIQVTVSSSGDAIDADGYSVVLDGGAATQLVDPDDTIVFGGLAPGEHTLDLQNVAGNCTVTSPNPATAEVTAGQQTGVAFTVQCEELTGSIQVDVGTTGDELDSNGYQVSLDGGAGLSIAINGSRTFSDVVIGEHEVELTGVASNCAVQGSNPRDVTVDENATAQVDFDVVCSATAGQIEVTVTTTGDDLDPNGYTVDLDGTSSEAVATNGSTTFTGVPAGNHTLTLQNFAPNCDVTSPNPTSTNVTAGNTSNVSFTVECTRTTGDIRVTTSTTGSPPDPNGYTVSVDGGGQRAIGNNDEELYLDLQPGGHTVTLSDVAVNCTVVGGAVRSPTVTADEETVVAYSIACVPLVGDVQVNVSTTGEDLDSGYTVLLDGGSGQSVGANGSTTFTDVSTGSHSVALTGVASNCSVSGTNPRNVTVAFGTTVDVDFDVTCVGLTGDLEVTTQTSGAPGDLDTDGYTIEVDGAPVETIGVNQTKTVEDLPDGVRSVELTGVADNCSVSGANPRNINVPAGGSNSTTFEVDCDPTTGSIEVDVTTSGDDQDPDGYTITLDGGTSRSVGINGSTTHSNLAPGDYDVGISGVASNCTVSESNPQTASVTAGSTSNVGFTVTCAGLTGDLTVNTSTTGDDQDPDGYTVTVGGGSARAIGIDDTETYVNLADGDHQVELTGVAANCSVSGSNPRTVNVPAGGTGSTTFEVNCDPITGSIEVTTTTSGTPDPDGYQVDVNGGAVEFIDDATPVVFDDLVPATYTVTLSGLDGGCVVEAPNPAMPTVVAGEIATVDFVVTCL